MEIRDDALEGIRPVVERERRTSLGRKKEQVASDRSAATERVQALSQPMEGRSRSGGETIIAVGAHPDDIELGCGGSIAYHSRIGDRVICVYLTYGEKMGDKEVRAAETRRACEILGTQDVIFLGFEDTNIPQSHEVIGRLDDLVDKYRPQRVYTHSLTDFHQDHRTTAQLSMAAFRYVHRVLSYEGPRVSAHFIPNYFVDISDFLDAKRRALECHRSQRQKTYMTHESMLSLARFRGQQVKTRFAEAFEAVVFLENPRPQGRNRRP